MDTIVDVKKQFYHRLTNRDENQGDGKHTAKDFREKFLSTLDSKEAWTNDNLKITFNFSEVVKIGPSFANEAFAYFVRYATPDEILKKIIFINISNVQRMIIKNELHDAYSKRK